MSKARTTTPARRRKGEGSITRFHNHPTCPPAVNGERPDHKCQGPYRAMVWVTTNTGKRVRKALYGKTEAAVVAKIKDLAAAEKNGEVVATTGLLVRDWLNTGEDATGWWAIVRDDLRVNTRKGYVSKINSYIIPAIGHHKLTALQPEHVRKMYADMRKRGLSEATCRQVHMILQRALKVAMWEGKVTRNVCQLIKPPSVGTSSDSKALTVEEAWKVLRAAGDNPRYWLALLTGLRQGEALALRWMDVVLDPEQGMPYLVVRRSMSREPGVGLVFDKPKSATSTDREVPLVTAVASRLEVARAKHLAAGGSEADLVFSNPRTGGPMDPRRDYNGWCVLLDLAGVRHVSLHGARHTTAHLLEDAGVPDRVVMEILGHSQLQMTHRYQQGNLPARMEAMRALEAHLSAKEEGAA